MFLDILQDSIVAHDGNSFLKHNYQLIIDRLRDFLSSAKLKAYRRETAEGHNNVALAYMNAPNQFDSIVNSLVENAAMEND